MSKAIAKRCQSLSKDSPSSSISSTLGRISSGKAAISAGLVGSVVSTVNGDVMAGCLRQSRKINYTRRWHPKAISLGVAHNEIPVRLHGDIDGVVQEPAPADQRLLTGIEADLPDRPRIRTLDVPRPAAGRIPLQC